MRTAIWLRLCLPLFTSALGATACGEDALSPARSNNLVPPTVAEDPALPAIEMNGSRFHVETRGDPANPGIVVLHGGPGGDYRSLLRLSDRFNGYSLADDYFLVYWDQRGAGLSERVDRAELTIDTYVNDLDSLVNRYAPGRQVFLIGESWGGMFATRYINEFPSRVAGAVLIEPGPLDGATMERVRAQMYELDPQSEWVNDRIWDREFLSPDDDARMDYEFMLGVRNSRRRSPVGAPNPAPAWRMGAAANKYILEDGRDSTGRFTYDFTTNLSAYTTSVLFIAGSQSEVLGESFQRQQIGRYPLASLQVVAGAGHDVAWVKSAEVVAHVRQYLGAR